MDLDALGVDEAIRRDSRLYVPSAYYFLRRAFRILDVNDVTGRTFVDMGCGLGRVLFFASQFPFRRMIGVEFSSALCRTAEISLIAYYRRHGLVNPPFEFRCQDARAFEVPTEPAVFLFNDPFGPMVLEPVLRNIVAAHEKTVGDAIVIYVNPTCIDVFQKFGFSVTFDGINRSGRGFVVLRRPAMDGRAQLDGMFQTARDCGSPV